MIMFGFEHQTNRYGVLGDPPPSDEMQLHALVWRMRQVTHWTYGKMTHTVFERGSFRLSVEQFIFGGVDFIIDDNADGMLCISHFFRAYGEHLSEYFLVSASSEAALDVLPTMAMLVL